MCVIFVAENKRPTEEMISQAFSHNGDGGGMAWRNSDRSVSWEKGCSLDRMQELGATMPLPFVQHFRISTCGGKLKTLTHPFVIEPKSRLVLKGNSLNESLLFHNGHWGRWKEAVELLAVRGNYQIPSEKWSDSRAMAWCAAHLGVGYLEFLEGQKIVVFGPDPEEDFQVFGEGWTSVNGILCSNTVWERRWTQVKSRKEREEEAEEAASKHLLLPNDEEDPSDESGPATGYVIDPFGHAKKLPPTATREEHLSRRRHSEDHFRRPITSLDQFKTASHQMAGGPSTGSPFDRKGLLRTWKDIHTLQEANILLAEEKISKSQYKKFVKSLDRASNKAWKLSLKQAEKDLAVSMELNNPAPQVH